MTYFRLRYLYDVIKWRYIDFLKFYCVIVKFLIPLFGQVTQLQNTETQNNQTIWCFVFFLNFDLAKAKGGASAPLAPSLVTPLPPIPFSMHCWFKVNVLPLLSLKCIFLIVAGHWCNFQKCCQLICCDMFGLIDEQPQIINWPIGLTLFQWT